MANMLDKLKSEVSNGGSNDFGNRPAKNGILRLGRKYSELVRIIPYPDRDFWYPYRTVWVDFNMNGKKVSTVLTFSYSDNHDDKLRDLVSKIINYNFKYRKDSKQNKATPDFTGDKIPLQFSDGNKPHYNATLRPMFALQAIKVVRDAQGKPTMQTISGSDIPLAQILNVPKTVMGIISNSVSSKDPNELASYADVSTGMPFKIDGYTQLRWINTKKSFPVFIHLDGNNRYQVEPHIAQVLGPINKALYAKDGKGHYIHLDNPAWIYEPTKTRAPKIWKMVYDQLKKRWDKEQNANGGKSYAQPTVDQAKAVRKNLKNDNSKAEATGNQSNPYDRATQSSATGQSAHDSSTSISGNDSNSSSATSNTNISNSNDSISNSNSANAPTDDDSQSVGSNSSQQAEDKSQVVTSKNSINTTKSTGNTGSKKLDSMDPNDIIKQALNGGK